MPADIGRVVALGASNLLVAFRLLFQPLGLPGGPVWKSWLRSAMVDPMVPAVSWSFARSRESSTPGCGMS